MALAGRTGCTSAPFKPRPPAGRAGTALSSHHCLMPYCHDVTLIWLSQELPNYMGHLGDPNGEAVWSLGQALTCRPYILHFSTQVPPASVPRCPLHQYPGAPCRPCILYFSTQVPPDFSTQVPPDTLFQYPGAPCLMPLSCRSSASTWRTLATCLKRANPTAACASSRASARAGNTHGAHGPRSCPMCCWVWASHGLAWSVVCAHVD